jgi:hypothetical protein
LILDDGCEIAPDSITNSTYDVVRIKRDNPGAPEPHFMEPMPLPAGLLEARDRMKAGIDDMCGVNESLFGQQSRETAAVSMQYATQQGNMIRRRLFNKYMQFVEDVDRDYLDIIRMKWDTPQMIAVLGKEKAFESVEIKAADIDGGFDFVSEYGTSLALDPITRRQEILTMLPLFEKAGLSPKTVLRHVHLNELDALYDMTQMGADRQREIFLKMQSTGQYIPPKDMRDHKSMLEWGYNFLMTAEFNSWDANTQALVEQHMREREALAAKQAGGDIAPAPEGMPGAAPELAAAGEIPTAAAEMPAPSEPQGTPPSSLGEFLDKF